MVNLQISDVVVASLGVFHELEETLFKQDIGFKRVNEQELKPEVLEILFFIFFLEFFLKLPFLPLRHKHKILRLDIFINHLDLVFGPFIQLINFQLILTRSEVNMHSKLVVTISTRHGLDVSDLLADRFLFAFEQIAQLDWRHHLATAVDEFDQHDALVF